MNVCLDAFAVLSWLQNERGAADVEQFLLAAKQRDSQCYISAINLGEVYYRLLRLKRDGDADAFWSDVRLGTVPLSVVDASRTRVRQAARLKGRYAIAYADAFAAQVAMERDVPLATGDPEFRALAEDGALTVQWL